MCPRPQGTMMGRGWHPLSLADRLAVTLAAGPWSGPTEAEGAEGGGAELVPQHSPRRTGGRRTTPALNVGWTLAQRGRVWGPGWGVDTELEMRDLSQGLRGWGGLCGSPWRPCLLSSCSGGQKHNQGWKGRSPVQFSLSRPGLSSPALKVNKQPQRAMLWGGHQTGGGFEDLRGSFQAQSVSNARPPGR